MSPDPESIQAYAESSPFTRLLETKSRVRIIDVFLGKYYDKLTRTEIAKLAGINQSSVSRNLGPLLDIGLVEKAGEQGSAETFTLNNSHPLAEDLKSVRRDLFKYSRLIDAESSDQETPIDPQDVSVNSEERDPRQLRERVGDLLKKTDA